MDSNNINKDNSNAVNMPYTSAAGRMNNYNTFQSNQPSSASNGNSSHVQLNSSILRSNQPPSAQSFPYPSAPQQSMNSLRTLPCGPSYSQYEGAEPVEDQAEHPPTTNGPLRSSLLQMLGGTYPRQELTQPMGGVREGGQGQDQAATQGQATLSHLNSMAEFYAGKGDFANAIKYYEDIINADNENGAAWTALGHCYLLTDSLQKAFSAYQRALYYLPDVRDPQLWYGIGLLYEKVYPFLIHSLKLMNILFLL